ncbi:MAG: hypothetical protein JWN76_1432, partial [Chitinophagaceae bacterium]|nr:hypothetical protein [Chitinophagaceae bacterium]
MQQLSAQKRSFPFFLVASFIIMPAMLVALFFLNARFGVMHG